MAYIVNEEEQNQQQGQGQQAPQQLGSAGGGFVGGAPVSTAGVGQGGQGGWTNIQAYLNANQGQSSSGMVKDEIGKTFNDEKQKFQTESTQAKSQAEGQASNAKTAKDQASQIIEQSSNLYNFKKPEVQTQQVGQAPVQPVQSDAYNQGINTLKSGLAAYTGPTQFQYGMGAKTQDAGEGLKGSDQRFNQMLANLYRQKAGGQIGQGALSLQSALDVNDSQLHQARQDLTGQYDGLVNEINTGVANTDQAVRNAYGAHQADSSALRAYLEGEGSKSRNKVYDAFNAQKRDHLAQKDPHTRPNFIKASEVAPELVGTPQGEENWTGLESFFNYTQPNDPTLDNAAGVRPDRGRFNAVMDALSNSDAERFGYDENEFQHGQWKFDRNKYLGR